MKGLIALMLVVVALVATYPVVAQNSNSQTGTFVLELDDNLIVELTRRKGLKSVLPSNQTFNRVQLKYVDAARRSTRAPNVFNPATEPNVDPNGVSSLILEITPELIAQMRRGKLLVSDIDPNKDIDLIKVVFAKPETSSVGSNIPASSASNSNQFGGNPANNNTGSNSNTGANTPPNISSSVLDNDPAFRDSNSVLSNGSSRNNNSLPNNVLSNQPAGSNSSLPNWQDPNSGQFGGNSGGFTGPPPVNAAPRNNLPNYSLPNNVLNNDGQANRASIGNPPIGNSNLSGNKNLFPGSGNAFDSRIPNNAGNSNIPPVRNPTQYQDPNTMVGINTNRANQFSNSPNLNHTSRVASNNTGITGQSSTPVANHDTNARMNKLEADNAALLNLMNRLQLGNTQVSNASGENGKTDAGTKQDDRPSRSDQPVATTNNRILPFLWFLFFCSVGLNFYLFFIWRSSYVRYQDLAEELRQTFSQTPP